MIGETDAKIKADGKNVVALKRTEAKKMIAEFESSYPKISEKEENLNE
jgi:hypothetical protein